MLAICIIWRGLRFYNSGSLSHLCPCARHCHGWEHFFLLQKCGIKVCAVLFGFCSSCLIVYIDWYFITTQQQTTTPLWLWLPSSQVNLLCWYYENTVLRLVWYCLIFIQLIIKFISIYPESTHSNEQQHHLKSLMSYYLVTAKHQDYIRGQRIIVREIINLIEFVCVQPSQKIH